MGMVSLLDRQKQLEACRHIRRLVDRTAPNASPLAGNARVEPRSNRTLPVILAPSEGRCVLADEAVFAVTKDLTGQGLSLVLNHPFHAEEIVIGFWQEIDPEFIAGRVCQNAPLGGGFWQLGVELREVVTSDWEGLHHFACLATQLLPETVAAV